MARAVQALDAPEFFVMLTRYYIESESYGASGLTVSATATPNLTQTQTGFVCDAFFAPELLSPTALRGKQAEGGRVRVRLEVRLEDVLQIVAMGITPPPSGRTTIHRPSKPPAPIDATIS